MRWVVFVSEHWYGVHLHCSADQLHAANTQRASTLNNALSLRAGFEHTPNRLAITGKRFFLTLLRFKAVLSKNYITRWYS